MALQVEFIGLKGTDTESRGFVTLSDDGVLKFSPVSGSEKFFTRLRSWPVKVYGEKRVVDPKSDPQAWLENLCYEFRGSSVKASRAQTVKSGNGFFLTRR